MHATLVEPGFAVICSLASGNYYDVRGTGAAIVAALSLGLVNPSTLAGDIAQRFPAVPRAGLESGLGLFLRELDEEGLTERYFAEESGRSLKSEDMPEEYGFIGLGAHRELADILTLDPIHDVSPSGWPDRG